MCIQYNKVHIINTSIKSTDDSTKKFKTYFHCGPVVLTYRYDRTKFSDLSPYRRRCKACLFCNTLAISIEHAWKNLFNNCGVRFAQNDLIIGQM